MDVRDPQALTNHPRPKYLAAWIQWFKQEHKLWGWIYTVRKMLSKISCTTRGSMGTGGKPEETLHGILSGRYYLRYRIVVSYE